MAKRKSTLDAFVPVRAPAAEAPAEGQQAPATTAAAQQPPPPKAPAPTAGTAPPVAAEGAPPATSHPSATQPVPTAPAAPAAPAQSPAPSQEPTAPAPTQATSPASTRASQARHAAVGERGEAPAAAGHAQATTSALRPTRAPRRRAAPAAGDHQLAEILESVARIVPAPESELRRLTLYLPPGTYERLQAVWAGVRQRTGLKVSRAALVLAALEAVLDSPELTEQMILGAVQAKLARSALGEDL